MTSSRNVITPQQLNDARHLRLHIWLPSDNARHDVMLMMTLKYRQLAELISTQNKCRVVISIRRLHDVHRTDRHSAEVLTDLRHIPAQ